MQSRLKFLGVIVLLIGLIVLHLFAGSTNVTIDDFYQSLVNFEPSNTTHIIARDLRIPRLLITLIAGGGLAIAGILMQTLFRNPLAEPHILGVSSGASLFVALSIMSGWFVFQTDYGIIASALLGAFAFGIILLSIAKFVRLQSSLLLVGIMIGSFSAAFISILQTWSEANQLKAYTLWSMGSLQQVSLNQIPIITILFLLVVGLSFFLVKSLNAIVLGSANAAALGVQLKHVRMLIILISSTLTGLITAFCGPIAFIGMAVPNLVKLIFKTQDHKTLLLGSLFIGAIFLLICDIVVQLLAQHLLVPINAITAIIGAPFIIYIILKRWS